MTKVGIIDFKTCNLDSIRRASESCGVEVIVADQPGELAGLTHVILPGVGTFARGMENLKARGLDAAIHELVAADVPCLGICLGMQLLGEVGTEGGQEIPGLGLIPGRIERLLPRRPGDRIPHIGWNEVNFRDGGPLFADIPSGRDFYFVHSYHFVTADAKDVMATTPYCGMFSSVVGREIVFGTQFHPEKSQKWGIRLLRNFFSY